MKKVIGVFLAVIALASCSKSDDNGKQNIDPIFSKEYFPLKDVKELKTGSYEYVGIKTGDRPVGLITKSTRCKGNDMVTVFKSTETKLDSIVYLNFKYENKKDDCVLSFTSPRTMSPNSLLKEGILKSKIREYYWREPNDIEKKNSPEIKRYKEYRTVYDGNMEIGFQDGYLRIEDYMSDYSKIKDEKVYLYFKKK